MINTEIIKIYSIRLKQPELIKQDLKVIEEKGKRLQQMERISQIIREKGNK